MKLLVGLVLAAVCLLREADSQIPTLYSTNLECNTADGWFNLGWAKCYKVFSGVNKGSYERAKEVCESYGSRLVTIKDQYENDLLGARVDNLTTVGEQYYIGLSKEKPDTCSVCTELRWSTGDAATDYQGFWADNEPDSSDGNCVYGMKNMVDYVYGRLVDYVYERPYVWTYGNCMMKRTFVCERRAAPAQSFHCFSGGFVSPNVVCDGRTDCSDGSDELNCPNRCRFMQRGASGNLTPFTYQNAQTCTWAIETPLETNAYVEFRNFNTEQEADFVTVYIGSNIETTATRVARISGNVGTKTYRSYNNMMFIKFSSDSTVTSTGFTGVFGSLNVSTGHTVMLTAEPVRKTYTVDTFNVAGIQTFLGQRDYIMVIETLNQYQLGLVITLQIEQIMINDDDMVMFFDGGSSQDKLLGTYCNSGCNNEKLVFSTGRKLSVLLRTGMTVTNNVAFRFNYRQGCYFETSDRWGTLFTPGYIGNIGYPGYVNCKWNVTVNESIAIYFDPNSQLEDDAYTRAVNGDYLKIYNNGVLLSGTPTAGFGTADIAGKTFTISSGNLLLEMMSSPTRSARGFYATWSIGCPRPNYSANNILTSGSEISYYTATFNLSCATGYAIQQEQIPVGTSSVNLQCGYMGKWLKYLQIPRCTPKYCGVVPDIANGYIESSTGSVYESEAVYKCYPGSNLQPAGANGNKIFCQADGTWSLRPSCVAARCPSGQISTSVTNGNGNLTNGDGTFIGSIYEFVCNAGFEFVGQPIVFCQPNGTWTQASAPTCKRLTCRLPTITNGRYGTSNPGDFINFGDSRNVNCNTGYTLANASISSVTCMADRTLTQLPMCVDLNECNTSTPCGSICRNTVGSYLCACEAGYQLNADQRFCSDINECQLDTDNCGSTCSNTPAGTYTCACSAPYVLYTADGTSGYSIPRTAGENGLLPTDIYHINHTCVLIHCPAPPAITNGVLLTQRVNHRYGDYVEYQCNIGYTPYRSTIRCNSNGQWDGTAPSCTPAVCQTENPTGLLNRALYSTGPYSYNQRLDLNCSLPSGSFQKYRFCTFNYNTRTYQMQGSPYECGVVDCGQPTRYPGTNYVATNTVYGSTFEFTCTDNSRQGQTNSGSASTVRCESDGYWDFGNLQCTGQSCLDPGFPAGGFLRATSFADSSQVTFGCNRIGYTLSNNVTLTCQGTNFIGTVPTCIDTQQPVISNCPTQSIVMRRYEQLLPRLPTLTVSDNTGVKSFTINPANANTTLFVTANMTVTYTAEDFAGNQATCVVNVETYDETPPTIDCLPVPVIELDTASSTANIVLNQATNFNINDNRNYIATFNIQDPPPATVVAMDLYKTYTYTAIVSDRNNNVASCRGQVFVKPRACSELSFPTPLNADKVCTPLTFPAVGLSCTLTCQDGYTFQDSKSKTIRCENGVWNTDWISACVRDVLAPTITCPPSQTISLSQNSSEQFVDFTVLSGSATITDLNTLRPATFTPANYTFRQADLYRPINVQMAVQDYASNTALCNFRYTAVPPACSPLALPTPILGTKTCTQRTGLNPGWDCTITCNTGKILRNIGSSTTVSCNDGTAWAASAKFPACIDDTKPPVITECPASRRVYLSTGDEVKTIDYGASGSGYTGTYTDFSGIRSVTFSPPSRSISVASLNQVLTTTMTVTDNAGLSSTCNFQELILAQPCSPLALPDPVNGNKTCVPITNGYSCTVQCNPNYSFYSTVSTSITTQCVNGGDFGTYVPDCAQNSLNVPKQFIGTVQYSFVPEDNTIVSVPAGCISYYNDRLMSGSPSTYSQMEGRLIRNCDSTYGPLDGLSIVFLTQMTTGFIQNSKEVYMNFDYTMAYKDPAIYITCSTLFNNSIAIPGNTYPFSTGTILGNGTCPTLKWNNVAKVTKLGTYCVVPYFESLTDVNRCVRCPAGTVSNGVTCSVCPRGTFSSGNSLQCESCPVGYTTRYPGATSSSQCIAPCSANLVSFSGYSPCYVCAKGYYRSSSTTCLQCGVGNTTVGTGAAGPEACIPNSVVNDEPCSIGTQNTGNNVCQLCPIGTYRSSTSQINCLNCPSADTSTYYEGATSSLECYAKCGSGFYSTSGLAPCTACPKGTVSLNSTYCQPCQSGFTTRTAGSTLCEPETDLRVKCPRGTKRDINTQLCVKCAIGEYNDQEESSCRVCENNRSTYFAGATASTMCFDKCPPGFYSPTGLSPCTPCGSGRFSNTSGSSTCFSCAANTITATTTSTSSLDCISQCTAGYFSYNGYAQNGACRVCPRNYYQNVAGSTSCTQCNPTTEYSNNQGLTASSECLPAASLCTGACQNGATCVIRDNAAYCQCPTGYYGPTCSSVVNYCASSPCYNNATCSTSSTGFLCDCRGLATGTRCETLTKTCVTSPTNPTCKNGGHCVNFAGFTQCLCPAGFSGNDCSVRTSICVSQPCNSTGTDRCEDTSLNSNLRRKCVCRPGYGGIDCEININDCASTPCINGGNCVDLVNGFQCNCASGYSGTYCQTRTNMCNSVNCNQRGGSATCVDVYGQSNTSSCICSPGYAYEEAGYSQYSIEMGRGPENLTILTPTGDTTPQTCRSRCTSQGASACAKFSFDTNQNRCYVWSSSSVVNVINRAGFNLYTKTVIYPDDDFFSLKYDLDTPTLGKNTDIESLNTFNSVYGLNICGGTEPLATLCCEVGKECLDNTLPVSVCTADGVSSVGATDYYVQFKCAVNRVLQKNTCATKSDYCNSNPCKFGSCVPEFGGYRCNCQLGYTGKNCQTNINECATNPCRNGGTCQDLVGGYKCTCAYGYEGSNCDIPTDFCRPPTGQITCSGHGSCENLMAIGYRCNCFPGYEGSSCENEVQNCARNPCLHGSTCQHRFNDYFCSCLPGWQGKNCDTVVRHCSLSTSGGQCQATCRNIFNSYYCDCPTSVYGTNCENRPNPCGNYNKCQNNAPCSYTTSMTCTCSDAYTGDGCQILKDNCGSNNPCMNGATCNIDSLNRFTCSCLPGYTGTYCQAEINECSGVTCPGGGTCYDDINRYYCRCPLKMTGTNCAREFDRNYDLYFNHPLGYNYAWIPYFINVEKANYLSLSLWVRYIYNDGTGVYLTQFLGNRIEQAEKFMELNEKGVKFYIDTAPNGFIQLEYDRNAKVNNGNWHLVTVLYDMTIGKASLYLDTVFHDAETDAGLIMPNSTFRMWVVLGCEFDNENRQCKSTNSFHGYLSQINWYRRLLTFVTDIPQIFANPQMIFDSDMSQVILVWNEYILESGVSRRIPSEAFGTPCTVLGRNPPCTLYRGSTMPTAQNCPSDIQVYSKDRITTVTWTPPSFNNLGVNGSLIQPTNQPGSTYTWGIYDITYVGVDSNRNADYCNFRLYVKPSECENPPDPYNGQQSCTVDTLSGRKGCMISCKTPTTYMVDRTHPDLFTCDPTGSWNYAKQFRKFRYPSCGLIKPDPKLRIYIRVNYRIDTSACIAVDTNIKARIKEEFIKLKAIFSGSLCLPADCSSLNITTTCGSLTGRKKRQTPINYGMLVDIILNSVDANTLLDTETISAVDFLTYFILGADVLNFSDTIPGGAIEKVNFVIQATPICPFGEVIVNGQCVECGPGNYFRYTDSTNTTAVCDDCELGTYQDLARQIVCKTCNAGLTTEMTGEYDPNMCKKRCPVGQYFDYTVNDCVPCPLGYYQDQTGQFRCKFCGAGFTTEFTGTNSSSLCSPSCQSGYQLNGVGNCVACPIGQYRNATETSTCVTCPTGYITLTNATKSKAGCDIIACSPGNYRDVTLNVCQSCPLNTYQPDRWQTSCISCGDPTRYRTAQEGSQLQSECLYYCPSGYQVNLVNTVYSCQICAVGYYKDNTLDIQGMCTACPGNLRTAGEGATSASQCTIYKCPVGSKANAGNTGCELCPLGTYQDVAYSTDCKTCAAGFSTRQTGSNSSSQCEAYCPSGQEKNSVGNCVSCLKGYYKNNADGLFGMCQACSPLYTTSGSGSTNVNQCNIRTCPAGYKRNADDSGCDPCPLGTYQPDSYQTTCLSCPTSTSTRSTNSTSSTQCESYCNSGFEKTSTGCVACAIGYYKDNANGLFSMCQLCPIDKITSSMNSTSLSQCTVANCSAGTYRQISDNTCQQCAKGYYQPTKWQTSCIQCGTDKTTELTGSTNVTDCILECRPGYEDIGGTCQMCARGFYKVESAAARCKICPTGYTTNGTGSTDPAQCSIPACQVGYYLDRAANQCKLCGYDTYQDQIWQEQCKACPSSSPVTLQMGSTAITNCVLNCSSGLQYNAGTMDCTFCAIGYYRNSNIRTQTSCQMCSIDKITSGTGARDVSECVIANCTDPGYYRDSNTNTCKKCPIGTYNSQKWVLSCTQCPIGNSTRQEGSVNITDCRSTCPLGQIVGANNQCELCPRGYYRSDPLAETCTKCPNGLLTASSGADNSAACSISPCFAGQKYILNDQKCVSCEVGTYQPNSGTFQCIDCPYSIKYTPSTGATREADCRSPCGVGEQLNVNSLTCERCPIGTYQPVAYNFTCIQCPEGRRVTAATGSTSIAQCLSYCSATTTNQCSLNATCTIDANNVKGYTCNCFKNYFDVQGNGFECVHQCDRGFCKNGATCERDPEPNCICSEWYKGDTCAERVRAEELSDKTLDIVIPVVIGVGGLILFLIILAVCCLCWRSARRAKSRAPQYSEFNGDRIDKVSVHSYGQPVYSRPPSRLMMLAPAQEMVYDNQAYIKPDTAVYQA